MGLRQRGASRRLGCSQTFLSMWLRGERELGRGRDEKWAEITRIPLRAFRMPRDVEKRAEAAA